MRRIGVGLLLAGLFTLFPAGVARPATIAYVSVKDFSFTPSTVTVKPGWEVRWTNFGPSAHTVHVDAGAPEDNWGHDIAPGDSYQRAFSTLGTYNYHCNNHPGMHGKVIVSNTAPPPPSPAPSVAPSPTRSASPPASPTPKKTKSPSPAASPSPSVAPTRSAVAPVATRSPSPSPSASPELAAAPKDSGGSRTPTAIALVVILGGTAVLVYNRFTRGT